MISKQQSLKFSPYMDIYNIIVPEDNMLRMINDLVDFSFVYDELEDKYCLDNGRNAIDPIRMFKYLLLKTIHDLSDVDIRSWCLCVAIFKVDKINSDLPVKVSSIKGFH